MLNYFANPDRFMRFSKIAIPIFALLAFVTLAFGSVWSLGFAPADYLQGQSARIIFVHVPAAWVAFSAYSMMAGGSLVYLVWRHNLADVAANAASSIGAAFTAVCLLSGSIWGRPTWGTWWVWDGRLTSMLVLLFIYLGYISLRSAISDKQKSASAGAILCLVGAVNIPIIRYSVVWWNTLHQPAAIIRKGGPSIHGEILQPLLLMGIGFLLLFGTLLMLKMRGLVFQNRASVLAHRILEKEG